MTTQGTPSNQQQQPYLVTSRRFPTNDPILLQPVLSKMYIEIARAVNLRTIGIFEQLQIVTGERWFGTDPLNALIKRQTYRRVYTFGAIAAGASLAIPHGLVGVTAYTRIYGTVITNKPDNRPIPYASVTANANIELNVDNTNINIIVGAGSPNVISGIVVLEYLLN